MANTYGGSVKLTGETEYKKALKDITSNLKLMSSEMKLATSQFQSGDKTLNQTQATFRNTNKSVQEQKEEITKLRNAVSQMEKEYGATNPKVIQFKTQLNNAEKSLNDMDKATNDNVKALKDFDDGTDKAGKGALKMGDIIKANLISDAIVGGIKALGGAMKSLGSACLDLGKQAVEGFADQEQLIGGVDTLFKDSSSKVQKYANDAFKTAGLSANEYMENVTSFSASLLQSVGGDTEKAADISNQAIIDMSDNANKMGTSMESIQNAYQGFAKQNYTMLDNLKLGKLHHCSV